MIAFFLDQPRAGTLNIHDKNGFPDIQHFIFGIEVEKIDRFCLMVELAGTLISENMSLFLLTQTAVRHPLGVLFGDAWLSAALHCIDQHCSADWTAPHCTTSHCIALHRTALHCTAHYTTLHCKRAGDRVFGGVTSRPRCAGGTPSLAPLSGPLVAPRHTIG